MNVRNLTQVNCNANQNKQTPQEVNLQSIGTDRDVKGISRPLIKEWRKVRNDLLRVHKRELACIESEMRSPHEYNVLCG